MKLLFAVVVMMMMASSAYATYGADLSQPFSISEFKCLKDHGMSFMIIRCFQSLNHPDANCPNSVANAWSAGMSHVDLYMFPCPKCGDAAGQVNRLVSFINDHHIRYGMLWFDIETPDYWYGSHSTNVDILHQLINAARAHGINVGIYASVSQWSSIMGGSTEFRSVPLWYAHWDGSASFSDWSGFGGWSRPAIKQYSDHGVSGCNNGGIDKNFVRT